ncbi:hypothetical protein WM00_25855 [Burkholderia cepacia]|nr:hypothetical protein WM00_25855 [Burkholderia cepacia]OUE39269.1 hypothetical protein BZY94_31180 [Burkholderia territorii]
MIFLAVGEVDAKAYDRHEHLERLRHAITEARQRCRALRSPRHRGRLPDRVRHESVVEFMNRASSTLDGYPNAASFASQLIFRRVNFLTA